MENKQNKKNLKQNPNKQKPSSPLKKKPQPKPPT